MKVIVFSDVRTRVEHNKYFSCQEVDTILRRYSNYFGRLKLCSRKDNKADSENESEYISDFVAINSLSKTCLGLNDRIIKREIEDADFIILRMPSFIGYRAAVLAEKLHKPYFAECMADPWDGLWNHGILGKIIAPYAYYFMKKSMKNAKYALYVTEEYLQKRYPCKAYSIGVSDVIIKSTSDSDLEKRFEKIKKMDKNDISIMTTAAVNVAYKGQQYVIKAIELLKKQGIIVKYVLVGGGKQEYLKKVAARAGVLEQVVFLGRRKNSEVFSLLDNIDIYIQPSLQEGLPRSLVEAMSRGCICIGAKTGGIPELLNSEFIVRKKNVSDIADVIKSICNSSFDELKKIAERNYNFSKNYLETVLEPRRTEFFKKMLIDITKGKVQ